MDLRSSIVNAWSGGLKGGDSVSVFTPSRGYVLFNGDSRSFERLWKNFVEWLGTLFSIIWWLCKIGLLAYMQIFECKMFVCLHKYKGLTLRVGCYHKGQGLSLRWFYFNMWLIRNSCSLYIMVEGLKELLTLNWMPNFLFARRYHLVV